MQHFIAITPFGPSLVVDHIVDAGEFYWITFAQESGICFWWTNQEIRWPIDWSGGRYSLLPFQLSEERIEAIKPLGIHHKYFRENILGNKHHTT